MHLKCIFYYLYLYRYTYVKHKYYLDMPNFLMRLDLNLFLPDLEDKCFKYQKCNNFDFYLTYLMDLMEQWNFLGIFTGPNYILWYATLVNRRSQRNHKKME